MQRGRGQDIRDLGAGKTHYTAFMRCYLNEAAVLEARNLSYPGWAGDGYLTLTPGNEADFDLPKDNSRPVHHRPMTIDRW